MQTVFGCLTRCSRVFQPQKIFEGDMCKYRYFLTPFPPQYACSTVSFYPFIFGKCSATIDIITALTTIHRKSKLQINIHVRRRKCLKPLDLFPGNWEEEYKRNHVGKYIASFPGIICSGTQIFIRTTSCGAWEQAKKMYT